MHLLRVGLLAALATACSEPAADLVILAGASPSGEPVSAFGFGEVGVLTAKRQVFTVVNAGDADAVLDDVALTRGVPFVTETGTAPGLSSCDPTMVLEPGAGCVVTIRFAPQELGEFTTRLVVSYNLYPSESFDLTVEADVRRFVTTYFLPGLIPADARPI